MSTFLSKLAAHIYDNYKNDVSEICIVLPNRRAGLFLKTALGKQFNKTIWSPEIYATEDFIAKLAGVEIIDNINLLFRFYEVYRKIEGENAQSFDEFSKWGQVLLHDFNETDSYLADPEKLFSYINEARAMELWNPAGQKEPTAFQNNYLMFWASLKKYYFGLKEELNKTRQAYQGLAYRIASENIENNLQVYEASNGAWKKIIFAGFNALNEAEEKIIKTLIDNDRAEILWDADHYYLYDNIQEAGRFLRKYKEKDAFVKSDPTSPGKVEKKLVWEENILSTEAKEIHIIGAAMNIGQAKIAGDILQKMEMKDNFQNTAIVLADENLLLPVLNSIPEKVKDVNVTMGYPLKNTPLFSLFDALFLLHESAFKMSKTSNRFRFYHKDIIRLLQHPFLRYTDSAADNGIEKADLYQTIVQYIRKNNTAFLSLKDLEKIAKDHTNAFRTIQPLFENWEDIPARAMDTCLYLAEQLLYAFRKKRIHNNSLDTEYLYYITKVIKRIKTLLSDYNSIQEIKTLRAIFNQIVSTQTLPFYGEPLKGLQLMGMLETRVLDFETVILLSANEGTLPSGKSPNSFIPYEIKRAFNLPTYAEKDAIFSYHFYRLIQRAKKVFLLYNTETDEFGSGEKSRFITQLIYELPRINPNVKITEQLLTMPIIKSERSAIKIPKTDDIIEKLDQISTRGLSPSALNTYINCPLDFYYKYVIGLRETEEVEENVEAADMGTFIHDVLERLYQDLIGKKVKVVDIKEMKPKVIGLINSAFTEKFSVAEVSYGKNFLSLNMAAKLIQTFLDTEIALIQKLEKQGKPLVIKSLEESLEMQFKLLINGAEKTIKLHGKADRIDQVGASTRIIDYKTGFVNESHLKNSLLEAITCDTEKGKSLQLLTYALMYQRSNPLLIDNIQSGIICFRKLSAGLMNFSFDKLESIDVKLLDGFEEELKKLILQIYDKNLNFEHRKESEYCVFCNV